MAKPGRNDPCHCGSGKKYKKCCQPKDEAPEREALGRREGREEARRIKMRQAQKEYFASLVVEEEEDEELTKASNAAVDLVQAGKFEEAEVSDCAHRLTLIWRPAR